MKLKIIVAFMMAVSGVLWPLSAMGQDNAAEKLESKRETPLPMYNPDTVETFSGDVIAIEHHTRRRPYGWGMHLRVRKDGGIIPVHVGPTWFLNDYDFYIGEGDVITITGSRIEYEGEPAILASEIKKGEDVLKLRDEKGRPVWTAAGRGMESWGRGSKYHRLYDPTTSETVDGEILELGYFTPEKGARRGVHLKLRSGADIVYVHLGPRWYIENQEMLLLEGDEVSVTGSRIIIDGRPTIIAASIREGDNVLMLRDKDGVPIWAGWRRWNR